MSIRLKMGNRNLKYGRQTVGKTFGKLGKLTGKDNPDGRGVKDLGVKVRRGRG